jgi:hypothetical protein
MSVYLLILLLVSLIFVLVLVAGQTQRGRARFQTPQARRAIGSAQLMIGALWLVWGGLFLRQHGSRAFAGLYALLLGLLWCWQGLRRLAR